MNVISTKYFDIIFSEESVEAAKAISENADELYLKAKDTICAKNEIRIVVVISPDSEKFSATYSPSPYNRIIIYDAIPDSSYYKYDDILLDAFYHEVLKAVGQSIRNGFIDKVSKIFAVDALQPVSLFNLPFSFVEGIASLEDENENVLNDNYNLQILMQAKVDGKFPSWINAAGSRDIYQSDELSEIAGIAFAAYLQQRFGLQKYIEFWEKSGNLYFVTFVQGIFHSVYGEKLQVVWQDFFDAIPVPEISDDENILESNAKIVFEKEYNKLYSNLTSTAYGLVWYDDLNHEIALYNPKSSIQTRRLLFYAEDVSKLSVDDSGRFLALSLTNRKMRENLYEYKTLIYDLKERNSLSEKFDLTDACILKTRDGLYAIAGIDMKGKNPRLSVVLSEDLNELIYDETDDEKYSDIKSVEIFSREFPESYFPNSLVYGADGFLAGLLNNDDEVYFYSVEIENDEYGENDDYLSNENLISLKDVGGKISDLQSLSFGETDSSEISYTFQFFPDDDFSFAKTGVLKFDFYSGLQKIELQTDNISGGVYSLALFDDDIYFYSKKTDSSIFRKINRNDLHYENVEILKSSNLKLEIPENTNELFDRNDYKKYNPLKYMFHGSWKPFVPVRDLITESGEPEPEFWPGLGIAYATQSDPLENNELLFSASVGFLKLDFTNIINPTEETLEKDKSKESEFTNNYTGLIFFKNTTTPVDVSVGGIIKFTESGQYNLRSVGRVNLTVPIGMSFRKLDFDLLSIYKWSTKYTGVIASEEQPDLSKWTNLKDSYRTYELSGAAKFSSIHQAGISPYEQCGLEVQVKIYSLWDYVEISGRKNESSENEDADTNTDDSNANTNPNPNYFNVLDGSSLVSFSFYSKLFVPRLNPLSDYDGWILSLPSTFAISVLKDKGTAFSATSEIMLIGKEIQLGVPVVSLYLTRFGLSLGYSLDFDYAIRKDLLPDIRSYKQFTDVFANTVLNDKISVGLDFVFSPVVGSFSKIGMNANFKFVYGVQTKESIFTFNMKFKL